MRVLGRHLGLGMMLALLSRRTVRASGATASRCLGGLRGGDAPAQRRGGSSGGAGVAFDLDGVVKQGGRTCKEALWALQELERRGVPYVFMTNGGGGRTEKQYAAELTKKLRGKLEACSCSDRGALTEDTAGPGDDEIMPQIDPQQMVLAYSKYPELEELKDKAVLVIGDPEDMVRHAIADMGFRRAVHLVDYLALHPEMDPFDEVSAQGTTDPTLWDDIGGILVVSDPGPQFWPALQVVVDVLLSGNPMAEELSPTQVPIYFSNGDLLWKHVFCRPRFGQGAYEITLRTLYKKRLQALGLSNDQIVERMKDKWHVYGKPEVPQQMLAERRIQETAKARGLPEVSQFFMVGDNPNSDMRGAYNARQAGRSWEGVLVRTGVYQDGDDEAHATAVVDSVAEAVDWILQRGVRDGQVAQRVPELQEQ